MRLCEPGIGELLPSLYQFTQKLMSFHLFALGLKPKKTPPKCHFWILLQGKIYMFLLDSHRGGRDAFDVNFAKKKLAGEKAKSQRHLVCREFDGSVGWISLGSTHHPACNRGKERISLGFPCKKCNKSGGDWNPGWEVNPRYHLVFVCSSPRFVSFCMTFCNREMGDIWQGKWMWNWWWQQHVGKKNMIFFERLEFLCS